MRLEDFYNDSDVYAYKEAARRYLQSEGLPEEIVNRVADYVGESEHEYNGPYDRDFKGDFQAAFHHDMRNLTLYVCDYELYQHMVRNAD